MRKAIFDKADQTYIQLPAIFYRAVLPESREDGSLLLWNDALAEVLGLDKDEETIHLMTGETRAEGIEPFAQSYAGHQFGQFTMLGDGRAIMIGEMKSPADKRYDVQLKGAGKTAYSRGGDGRASLGPMLREYIVSEAMHQLGVPTSRGLAVTKTGNTVLRERKMEGAVLTRVAASHLRVGTFEFAAAYGDEDVLKQLANYAVRRHDPLLMHEKNPYIPFVKNVMKRQASLLAKWQLVGFVHGVMNTDNMTISGETIDYGPCAFIDRYDRKAVFSSIDLQGRYRYGNQPHMAQWNIARLAESLLPLFADDQEKAIEIAEDLVGQFPNYYMAYWLDGMRAKLGLFTREDRDEQLVNEWLGMMEQYRADYTQTFMKLTFGDYTESVLFHSEQFKQWYPKWQARLASENKSDAAVFSHMKKHNPVVIPRNRWVEDAIQRAEETGELDQVHALLDIMKNPYAYTEEQMKWGKKSIPDEDFTTYCGT